MGKQAAAIGGVTLALLAWAGTGIAYDVIDVRNGGAIAGTVTFTGVPPSPRRFAVKKGVDVCGTDRVLTKVDVRQGMVRGVILALEGVERGKPFLAHHEHAEGRGRGAFQYAGGDTLNLHVRLDTCSFGPFTGVMMAEEAMRVVNHDAIRHTLHTYALKGRSPAMLKTVHARILGAGSRTDTAFPATRLHRAHAVALTCDRHDFMENWLYLVRNPYYAMSDKAGRFRIDQIPPGEYRLVAWHPVLGTKEQHVIIAPQSHLDIAFAFAK